MLGLDMSNWPPVPGHDEDGNQLKALITFERSADSSAGVPLSAECCYGSFCRTDAD